MKNTNLHHTLPESRGGTRHPDNLVRLQVRYHDAIHTVFGNQTPIEQLRTLLTLNKSLTTEVTRSIQRILDDYRLQNEQYAYKNGVLIPHKFLQYDT